MAGIPNLIASGPPKSKVFTILVLLSGGCFRALALMNSNLFGLALLSAGLSTLQLQRFRSYHVVATVMMENVPQIVLQYYFLFVLELHTATAFISLVSSIFNILLSILSVVVFHFLHRNQTEKAFSILMLWTKKEAQSESAGMTEGGESKSDLDPFARCTRRSELGKSLKRISEMNFEILATKKLENGCLFHGVCVSENSVTAEARRKSTGGTFADFMSQQKQIQNAVESAFGLDDAAYSERFTFSVTISESTQSTRADKVKLVMDGLEELKASQETLAVVQESIAMQATGDDDDGDGARAVINRMAAEMVHKMKMELSGFTESDMRALMREVAEEV